MASAPSGDATADLLKQLLKVAPRRSWTAPRAAAPRGCTHAPLFHSVWYPGTAAVARGRADAPRGPGTTKAAWCGTLLNCAPDPPALRRRPHPRAAPRAPRPQDPSALQSQEFAEVRSLLSSLNAARPGVRSGGAAS